jgi:hypothetical protein
MLGDAAFRQACGQCPLVRHLGNAEDRELPNMLIA